MSCKHERLRAVGDRIFCCSCGEEFTLEFLESRNHPAEAEKQAEKAAPASKADKAPVKKRTAKKAV